MIGAEQPLAGGDVLAEQRRRSGQVAPIPQEQRQLVLARRGFPMLLTENLAANRQCFPNRRLGELAVATVASGARQFDQRDGDVLMHVAEQPPPHCQAFHEQRLGGSGVSELALQYTEVIEALRDPLVFRAERMPADRDRLFQERQRLVEQTHPFVSTADDREHLGLQLGLIAEFL